MGTGVIVRPDIELLAPGHQFRLSELARHIDSTLLKPTATVPEFDALFDEAAHFGFWSVCVPPSIVKRAAGRLGGTGVKVCTVVGFPLGYASPETKRDEALRAVQDGADEIDMVMNLGAFKSGDLSLVSREIESIASVCRSSGKLLKVIIECCYLDGEEKVKAAKLAERAGADYVKTSTGFGSGGATIEDVALLAKSLSGAKVKASGGVSSLEKAVAMMEAGADRIGTSSGSKIMGELRQKESTGGCPSQGPRPEQGT